VIYSYNKNQQDILFPNFILVKNSTCFGQTYCPSSGAVNTLFTSVGICHASMTYTKIKLRNSASCWLLL